MCDILSRPVLAMRAASPQMVRGLLWVGESVFMPYYFSLTTAPKKRYSKVRGKISAKRSHALLKKSTEFFAMTKGIITNHTYHL